MAQLFIIIIFFQIILEMNYKHNS